MTEAEYVRRAEAVRSRLYRTALLYLNSEALAVDAVDEAIYRGLLALKKLRQPEHCETWLTRILINVCKTEQQRRRRSRPLEDAPEASWDGELDHLPLREAIARLPDELRAVVILRFFAGYTLEETARALEVPRGTVTSRQKRALELLRLDLKEE